jgi:hypothetical protein
MWSNDAISSKHTFESCPCHIVHGSLDIKWSYLHRAYEPRDSPCIIYLVRSRLICLADLTWGQSLFSQSRSSS